RKTFCYLAQFLYMRPHLGGTKCTVESYTQRLRVAYRSIESLQGLPAQCSSRGIGDRSTDHDGQFSDAIIAKKFLGCKDRGLRIECVEDRFYQQQVDTTFDQSFDLFRICCRYLIKRYRPVA